MRISPVNYGYKHSYNSVAKQSTKAVKSPSFTSLFADASASTERAYGIYTMLHPGFKALKSKSTRIFRELPSQIAISRLIDPDKKTHINILGCSDGSEAWAYAITLKEELGEKAKENVKIDAVDYSPAMITMAKTGRIIISDIERKYANGSNTKDGTSSPIRGEGWDKHLIKSSRPDDFEKAVEEYPYLKYMEFDPVAQKTIGAGLDWYKINKEGLPDIDFICTDMQRHIRHPHDEADTEVYVMANAGAYVANDSIDDYIKLFSDIKKMNEGKGKEIYVVTGDVENRLVDPNFSAIFGITLKDQSRIKSEIASLGFKKVSKNQLKKRHVENYKDASSKVYKLVQ